MEMLFLRVVFHIAGESFTPECLPACVQMSDFPAFFD